MRLSGASGGGGPRTRRTAACLFAAALLLAPPASAAATVWGDVNGDGVANPADAFRLVDLLGAGQAPPDADFDGNGATDRDDATHLLRQLLETGVVAAATVGPAGGTVSAPDGCTVQVPPGLLTEDRRVEIERAPLPPGVTGESDRYLIHGLPATFDGEVTVTIPVRAGAAARQPLRGRAPSAYAPTAVREYAGINLPGLSYSRAAARAMIYYLQAAAGAVDTVVVTLRDFGIAAADAYGIFSVGRLVSLETDAFEIMVTEAEWEAYQETLVLGLTPLLDEVHADLASVTGLAWSTIVPRHRVIFEASPGLEAEMVQSNLGNFGDFVILERSLMTGGAGAALASRPVIAHELMHLLQAQYDPRWGGMRRNLQDWWGSGGIYLWLHEAVATWAETRFAPAGPATPDVLAERAYAPFEGMQVNGNDQTANQRHGYGMAGLIKYLADIRGDDRVGAIYKKMRDYWVWYVDGVHPIEAILAAASPDDPADLDWWYQFWATWMVNSLYPGAPTAAVVRTYAAQQNLVVDLPASGVRAAQASKAFRQLAGTPYVVRLAGRSWAPGDTLTVTYGGVTQRDGGSYACADRGIVVFRLPPADAGRPMLWLGDDQYAVQVTVADLAAIAGEGDDLLVVVLNRQHASPYTGSNAGTVDFNVGNLSRHLTFPSMAMDVTVTGPEALYPDLLGGSAYLVADYPAVGTSGCLEVTATPGGICTLSPNLTLWLTMFGTQKVTPAGGCATVHDTVCGTLNGFSGKDPEVSAWLEIDYGVGNTTMEGWSVAQPWENGGLCPW